MKKLIAVLSLAFVATLASAATAATQQLVVTGMTCSSCAASVTKAFKKNPEVTDVKVDVKSGKVVLTFKGEKTMTEDEVRKTVEEAGYQVKTVQPAAKAAG